MSNNNNNMKSKEKSLYAVLAIVVVGVILMTIAGFLFINPASEVIQGEAEATSVRVSGKLPGRVAEFYVNEGATVSKGDTLVRIYSSVVDAKLVQAEAMRRAASAQNQRVDAGAREQVISSAHDLWQQALAAKGLAEKSFDRMDALFAKGVVTAQKRDEAEAAFKGAAAAASAAEAQYNMALEGATREDKIGAHAMMVAAEGSVMEVQAILEDQYLLAPTDGEIVEIYPNIGELVAAGTPILSILKMDDMWMTFNVREQMLSEMTMGKAINVTIPALNNMEVSAEIFYIRDMGSYAIWSATKAVGEYDSKTFKVKARATERVENLRPGMSILLVGN